MWLKLISWKHSFKRLNEEYEIAKKKKQALDNLFETGRISQLTHESFNGEIAAAMSEIERQQNDLLDKMKTKMKELDDQIKTLEMLFANYEIQHVAGEVDEEVYQREINILAMGLETSKHELDTIKEAVNMLSPPVQTPTVEECVPQEAEIQPEIAPAEAVVEAPQPEVEIAEETVPQESVQTVEEKLPEPPVEQIEVTPMDSPQVPQENPPEASSEASQEESTETSQEPVQSEEEATAETAENEEEQET
jgi:hypothetical protein